MRHLNLRGKRNALSNERNCAPPEHRANFPFCSLHLQSYQVEQDSDTLSRNTLHNKEGKSLISGWKSLAVQSVKNPPVMQRPGFDPWVRNIPWRREWQPTTLFLPREFHGQRSLEGCSCKQLDMTEGHSRYTYTYTQRQTHRQDCFKLLVS